MPTRSAATRADVEHEREVAIFDLLERNSFALENHAGGPYTLHLSLADNRLVFTVGDDKRAPIVHVMLSLSPFRRLVKDYFLMCESYYQAVKTAPPSRIEAIDMGRRGLHDEGSRLLWSGSRARSSSTSPPRDACSRSSARSTGRDDALPGETPTCRARSSSPAAAMLCARRWPPPSCAISPAGASM